jgi:amino acid adenylation domain-containing protein
MQLIQQWVEARARRTPDATALVYDDEALSYAELNRRANRWASKLRSMGVVPDSRVALCMQRGIDLIVAMLATLKAGGAYVPLDPAYPAERLAYMLADSRPQVVLTQAGLAGVLHAGSAPMLRFDSRGSALDGIEHSPADPRVPELRPQHLAYVIYTSGSTGQPKGVMNHHAGLANLIPQLAELFQVDETSRVLQFASPSFDASVLEIALALCHGATLCLAPREAMMPGEPLLEILRRHRVTHLTVPPSALSVLEPGATLPSVRTLVVAGEACPPAVVRRWAGAHRMINIYGPTETTIFVTAHHCQPNQQGSTPIGRPIGNVPIQILDAQGRPVAEGEAGEIFVGGIAVARGYLDRPELTAQRFVEASSSTVRDNRLYKTGDLGRWLPDGGIEYLGRSDHQVKIRGYRIELGEIEARLEECAQVHQAVVLAREDVPGDKRLVAYLAPAQPGARIEFDAIRAQIARFLPAHMLPNAWVAVAEFPLTPNGKVDRQALAAPPEIAETGAPYEAPQGEFEIELAGIWCEVLRLARVGRHDNFFLLGGHSLLATQVASRVRQRLGKELHLRAVFETPTLREMAVQANLGQGCGRASANEARVPMQRIARTGPLPTSYSQRRMWLIQQLNPKTTAYNVPFAFRLLGALNRDALLNALRAVTQRHEAFRTSFEAVNGEPMAKLVDHSQVKVEYFDFSAEPEATRESGAQALLREITTTPFDLARPLLHRVALVRLGERDHAFLWLIHHAICDYWAGGILLRELQQAYCAALEGKAPGFAPLTLEYADHAAWERQQVLNGRHARELEFWRAHLRDLPALKLPSDMERRGPFTGQGGTVYERLPRETLDRLKGFSAQHRVSPFMTLLACFQVMLLGYSGQLDFAVGTPIANRDRIESEDLVGTLVNTLVMRADLTGEPTFAELLRRVQARSLEAFAHQGIPFERVVEELAVRQGGDEFPLVRVMFNVVNAPFKLDGIPGLRIDSFDFDQGAAQFDLAFTVDTDLFGLVQIDYASDLFAPVTVRRMLDAFIGLVEESMTHPNRKIAQMQVVGVQSRQDIGQWQGATMDSSEHRSVAALLRGAAAGAGSRVALADAKEQFTFEQLERKANRLARTLRARGIARGALVGLCVDRSASMVIAQLAILKSGAAYVPLDPAYPPDRLAMMAEDAQLALLVTQATHAPVLAWPREKSLWLDADAASIEAQDAGAPAPDASLDAGPDDPAYVIYTSGSTGKPKGVAVPHGAVLNFLASMAREPGLRADDRVLAVTTLSFDIAVLELLLPLSVGATIILATTEQAQDGRALRACLEQSQATLMQATPSTWRMLLEAGWQGTPTFKALIGGEGLPLDLAKLLLARTGELWNMYGPTETTVWSTCWRVEKPESGISIGRPIANTQVHVLDESGRQCPIGVPGEIYIGGDGVAIGYLNRPELTSERFVADPFRATAGARMYRTGDLGRWRHDGLLEHQGRLDHQVKIRGFRIELGEIEANLASIDGVARAIVVAREDTPGDTRIVAYIVPRGAMPSAAALREHVRAMLPQYMVPQHFVHIDAVPLLPNGKMDRSKLPKPGDAVEEARAAPQALETELERGIAEVWQRLLNIDSVGRSDNFFDLGGHSLLAMRAVSEIETSLGVVLSPRRLIFETLAQLAAAPDAPVLAPKGEAQNDAAPKSMLSRLKRLFGAKAA